MKKLLKNHDVYTLPETGSLELVVDPGAEVWVECAHAQVEGEIKMKLKSGAHVRWMSSYHGKCEKNFTLEEGAMLDYYHHVLGSSDDEVTVNLLGNESRVLTQTIFFGEDGQKQNLRVNHVHKGKNTRSQMISRGAVKDKAASHFFGNITMLPGCSGADGNLEEHNLLLSSGSKIEAVPALEIHHDEVQASHSATLERIDDEKLFYLQSRGLPTPKALELLVEGFFWDALRKCPNQAFAERIFKDILRCL